MTVGQKVEHASKVLLPAGNLEAYLTAMGSVFSRHIHYVDPVHEYRDKDAVLSMLRKYVPRVANSDFTFDLVHDGEKTVIWKWRIVLKIRFTPFRMVIHGLVEAQVEKDLIIYQREYYDPMESIGVIPLVGWIYKLVLKMG